MNPDLKNMIERLQTRLFENSRFRLPKDYEELSEIAKYEFLRCQEVYLQFRFWSITRAKALWEARIRANIEARDSRLIVESLEFRDSLFRKCFWLFLSRKRFENWLSRILERV
jgi:hypothetical protein